MRNPFILFTIIWAMISTVMADSILIQEPENVVRNSPLIVNATIKRIVFKPISNLSWGEAWITLVVGDKIVGDCPPEIVIRRGHVTPDLQFLKTDWNPPFRVGEHFIICLLPTSNGYSTMGLYNGKFVVELGKIRGSNLMVEEFVNEIREIRNGERSTFSNEGLRQTHSREKGGHQELAKQLQVSQAGSHLNGEFITWDFTWDESYVPVQMHYNDTDAPNNAPNVFGIAGLASTGYALWVDQHSLLTLQHGSVFPTSEGPVNDDFSVMLWRDGGNANILAEAHTYPNDLVSDVFYGPGSNQGIDVWFNPNIAGTWYFNQTPPSSRITSQIDFVEVLAHELGHGIGLQHVANTSSIMYSAYLKGDVPVRSQSDGDFAGRVYQHTVENLSGTLSHSVVLSANRSTFSIANNLTVPASTTLEIEPLKNLTFTGPYKLRVEGVLQAQGTGAEQAANPVTFTSTGGQWYGIEFYNGTGSSLIRYAHINNAQYGVYNYSTDVAVTNSWIHNNSTGIFVSGYPMGISWNKMENNTYGVRCEGFGDANIQPNNVLRSNDYSVYGDGTSAPNLGSLTGYNSLYWNGWDVYSIYSGTISARGEWWGSYPAMPFVTGNVDYSNELSFDPNNWAGSFAGSPDIPQAQRTSLQKTSGTAQDTIGMSEVNGAYRLYLNEDHEGALDAFEVIIAKYTESFAGARALVFADRIMEGLGRDAKGYLNARIQENENSKTGATARQLLVGRLVREASYDEALSLALSLVANQDRSLAKHALYNAANIAWYRLNDKQTGEDHFRRLIAEFPNDPLSHSALATLGESSGAQEDETSPLARSGSLPNDLTLQNYPNPFNPVTIIRFTLPEDGFVSLKVYDVLGRQVRMLVNEHLIKGIHQAAFDASGMPSGVYFYKVESGSEAVVRKMMVVR